MRSYKFFLLTICFLIFTYDIATADSIAVPMSYTVKVGNGEQYIFVMLGEGKIMSKSGKDYPKSGLYKNDGSITPIWTVDFYSHLTYVTSEGKYLVEMGPWPELNKNREPDTSFIAFSLYEKGKKYNDFTIKEFISFPSALQKSVSHYEWLKDISFNSEKGQLKILTTQFDYYVIDVRTGNYLFKFKFWYLTFVVIFIIVAIIIWAKKRKILTLAK